MEAREPKSAFSDFKVRPTQMDPFVIFHARRHRRLKGRFAASVNASSAVGVTICFPGK